MPDKNGDGIIDDDEDGEFITVPRQEGGPMVLSRRFTEVQRVRPHAGGKPLCSVTFSDGIEVHFAVSWQSLRDALRGILRKKRGELVVASRDDDTDKSGQGPGFDGEPPPDTSKLTPV